MNRVSRRSLLASAGGAGLTSMFPTGLLAQAAPNRSVVVRGSRVFDGSSPDLITGSDVLIVDGMIRAIGADLSVPDDARVIDADGRTLMPGLIDCHWHSLLAILPQAMIITADFGLMTLYGEKANQDALMRGFTTVRDVGGNVFPLYHATNSGLIQGPRIYPSGGYIGQTGGHNDYRLPTAVPTPPDMKWDYQAATGNSFIVDGVPEMLQRAREILRMGATQLKLMAGGGVSSDYDPVDVTQFTFDEMKAACDVAKNWDTYVTIHAFTSASVRQSIEAGVACVEHGMLLDDDTLSMIADLGVWLSIQPILDDEDAIFPEGSAQNQRDKFVTVATGTENVYGKSKELGLKLAFGTDTLFSPELAEAQGRQLAKLTRWFAPHEALAQATSQAGELCKLCGLRDPYPGALGVVAEGAHADLILVNGDPLADIDLIADPDENFSLIMKAGEEVKNTLG